MRVEEIWRFPVKSMGGERLTDCAITRSGIPYDRGWGVVDPRTGLVLTARREPRLLMATAIVDDDRPLITTHDGHRLADDDDLSEWLDRPAVLTRAAGRPGGRYENPLDPETERDWAQWQGPPSAWHDSGRTRVSIVGTATLGEWDRRRFRANVVVEGTGEDALVGHTVKLGTAELRIEKRIERCVMVGRPQPGLERRSEVLRRITTDRHGCLGVGATVTAEGRLGVGDELTT